MQKYKAFYGEPCAMTATLQQLNGRVLNRQKVRNRVQHVLIAEVSENTALLFQETVVVLDVGRKDQKWYVSLNRDGQNG